MSAESLHESTTTRATVYAGSCATDYAHAGRGAPVVFIGSPLEQPLFSALAARFRVIAPEMPCRAVVPGSVEPSPSFATWLRNFLDCLGVARVSLVAEASFGIDVLKFGETDPARVDRLVLLTRDAADPDAARDVVRDLLGGQRDVG